MNVDSDTHLTMILRRRTISIMYVCLCKSVTDSDIKRAVDNGAASFREVRDQLGVSTQCGKCARLARAVVQESLPKAQDSNVFYNAAMSSDVAIA